jgi:cytochrome c oxidase subunit 3
MAEHTSETHGDAHGGGSPPPPAGGHAAHDHGHGHYPNLAHHFDTPQQQFDAGKLGIWLFLLTEVLFFSGLFCAYTIYRAMRPEVFVYAHYFLDTKLGALNTCVLLGSSLTAAWAVRNAQLGETRKLVINIVITIACACTFMVVKYFEYSHKYHDGLLPGKRFQPTEQVWELASFKQKHPEAAEYAERLTAAAQAKAAGGPAQPAGAQPMEPSAVKPADPSAAKAAEPSAAQPAAPAGQPAAPAGQPAAPAGQPAAPAGQPAAPAGQAAAPAGQAAAPAGQAAAPAAQPAAPADAAPTAPLTRPTREQIEPLIKAGVLGAKAENPSVPSRPRNAHVFFGIYFFMTGLHGFHVLAGIGVFVWLLLRAKTGVFNAMYFGPIDYAALYWHLVDLIWIYLFPLLYLIH